MRICTEIQLDNKHYFVQYVIGLVLGFIFWKLDFLIIHSMVLNFSTGIGFFLLGVVALSFVLLGIDCFLKRVPDGFSLKIATMAIKGSSKASLVLLGVITMALCSWLLESNITALKTSLLGLILSSVFLYYWWTVSAMFYLAREKGL